MNLQQLQHWLGTLIAQPLQPNHQLPKKTPYGSQIHEEAARFIAPSKTLESYQRLQVYHQQYWWRLIQCLQTNFPMLIRLFGYSDFETKIAVPYLSACPPSHWTLCSLGDTLPDWLHTHYHLPDKYLVQTSAEIDWAANKAVWVRAISPPNFSHIGEETLHKPLTLQPFVSLFSLKGDFFSFREALLSQEPDYYNKNHFPSITYGEHYFLLYRTPQNVVRWSKVSQAELCMLSQFRVENTIEKACAALEERGGPILEAALSQIPLWFKRWALWVLLGSS